MGNQHSGSYSGRRPRKNVHWKAAECPSPPGKPDIVPSGSAEEPTAVTLRWLPPRHDGGAPVTGFHVECNRLGSPQWVRTAPRVVLRPELVLAGLEPGFRYQFRVSAENAAGVSLPGEMSDILTVSLDRTAVIAPKFVEPLHDVTSMENERTELKVYFEASPAPTVSWFKDGFEIFSSRRTAIVTESHCSSLIFHQTSMSDEGEIKCTATNRAGHAVSRARLQLEAAPRVRLPRQYEEGLLYETNETIFLKVSVAGKPAAAVEWRHDGQPLVENDRIEISITEKFSTVRIANALRKDRGEYQVIARNRVGEDSAAFLVTITARPDPPDSVAVAQNADKSVGLSWVSPDDDGGCQVSNYIIEYYRTGWNVWLKAATSRKLTATLFDLIEGSEYKFRIKAESPYGVSEPSGETKPIFIPGKSGDVAFNPMDVDTPLEVLNIEQSTAGTPLVVPRRKRQLSPPIEDAENVKKHTLEIPGSVTMRKQPIIEPKKDVKNALKEYNHEEPKFKNEDKMKLGSSEFMLVLYPEGDKLAAEKRKSFQLDLEDAMSPPPMSFSAPDLGYNFMPIRPLRNSVSSTELLHEHAMDRFYQVIALKEAEKLKAKRNYISNSTCDKLPEIKIPDDETFSINDIKNTVEENIEIKEEPKEIKEDVKQDKKEVDNFTYEIDNTMSSESLNADKSEETNSLFEEDYTASTVSTGDSEFSDSDSLEADVDRLRSHIEENTTYHPKEMSPKVIPPPQNIQNQAVEVLTKPAPLPDPSFIPKPILKRREEKPIEPIKEEKPSKYSEPLISKVPLFKKFAKFPTENRLADKLGIKKSKKNAVETKKEEEKIKKPDEKSEEKKENEIVQDEGRSVIEHYGNLVKEFGKTNKPQQPLYTNTAELKKAAAKQQLKAPTEKEKKVAEKTVKTKNVSKKPVVPKTTQPKSTQKKEAIPKAIQKPKSNAVQKEKISQEEPKQKPSVQVKPSQPIETATVPRNFDELNAEAESTIKSVFNYIIDLFILLVAFWLYFFKDERLAIPFLGLTMYRQVHSAVRNKIPTWIINRKPVNG